MGILANNMPGVLLWRIIDVSALVKAAGDLPILLVRDKSGRVTRVHLIERWVFARRVAPWRTGTGSHEGISHNYQLPA
jgi:hypothetical protein